MSTTPRGYPLLTESQTYALVTDYNKLAMHADATNTVTEARAEYLTDKAVADAGALSRQALNALPRHVASEVDRVIGDTREDAAEARSIAQQAYEYNQTLVAPVADVVDEIIADPATESGALVAGKVDESEGAILARRMGATGNGVDDDTAALQAAIDKAEATGRPLWLAPGEYKVTGVLRLPVSIQISGASSASTVYSSAVSQAPMTRILSYGDALFVPKDTASPSCYLRMQDITFIDKTGAPRSVLFKGLELRGSHISKITAGYYDVVFEGPGSGTKPVLSVVSTVRDSTFNGVREAVTIGGVVDSKITGNYINASPRTHNAYAFSMAGWSTSTVSENYIDFFTHVFRLDGVNDMLMVHSNLFDYCYRVVGTPPGTTIRAISRANFTGNVFHRCMWSYAKNYFTVATPEMQTEPWTAFDLAGVQGLVVSGNTFHDIDRAFRVTRYPNFEFQVRGNTFQNVTKTVEWSAVYNGAGDQRNITVEPWHGSPVSTLPPALLRPGHPAPVYDGLEIIHNGRRLRNDAGTWRDALGNAVTA